MAIFGRDREFEELLASCLEKLERGATVDACLDDHQDSEERLRPLLEAAAAARLAASTVRPSDRAKRAARERMLRRLRAGVKTPARARFLHLPRVVAVPVAALLALAVVILGGGSVAAAAAADSVPGDTLYWVKRTKESVMLGLAGSDEKKARMHAELAGVRGQEMGSLIEQGRIAAAERHLEEVHDHLRATAQLVNVVVTLNNLETPSRVATGDQSASLLALVITLERAGDVLRVRPLAVGTVVNYDHSRIEKLRREFELPHRVVAAAIYPEAASGNIWGYETVSLQSSLR